MLQSRSFATCRQHLGVCRPVHIASLWCCVACVQQSVPTATWAPPVSPAPWSPFKGSTELCAAAPPAARGSSRLYAMPASAAAPPLTSHVLVHNGEAAACTLSSGEWLQSAPRGEACHQPLKQACHMYHLCLLLPCAALPEGRAAAVRSLPQAICKSMHVPAVCPCNGKSSMMYLYVISAKVCSPVQ
jgi:hypothetical protein